MANPFDTTTGFPGQADGKGNANVITETFHPDNAPPVDVSDPTGTSPPVEPDTEATVDLTTLLPTFPPENFLGASEQERDFPGDLPDIFDGIL